jgi:type VI secretion system protein ImpK
VSTTLNAASDAQSARMLAAPPGQMPTIVRAAIVEPPVAPLEIGILDRLRIALRPDIDASAVTVTGTPTMVVLRVNTKSGFAAGSATPIPALTSLLERIGTILKGEPGSLRIIAYTDNHPIRTVRFPSNFELSGARASAASAVIGRVVGDPARLSHEGRGDADPIAPNTTAEGRDLNRRIEIVLRPPE